MRALKAGAAGFPRKSDLTAERLVRAIEERDIGLRETADARVHAVFGAKELERIGPPLPAFLIKPSDVAAGAEGAAAAALYHHRLNRRIVFPGGEAGLQGKALDDDTAEQPGKIMHETRKGEMAAVNELPFGKCYGGVDTTPLFVMLLGELRRWGLAPEVVDRLLPHAHQALACITDARARETLVAVLGLSPTLVPPMDTRFHEALAAVHSGDLEQFVDDHLQLCLAATLRTIP